MPYQLTQYFDISSSGIQLLFPSQLWTVCTVHCAHYTRPAVWHMQQSAVDFTFSISFFEYLGVRSWYAQGYRYSASVFSLPHSLRRSCVSFISYKSHTIFIEHNVPPLPQSKIAEFSKINLVQYVCSVTVEIKAHYIFSVRISVPQTILTAKRHRSLNDEKWIALLFPTENTPISNSHLIRHASCRTATH